MTKYEIYTEDLDELIAEHFKSKKEFRKKLGISPSHLHKLLKGEVKLGDKVKQRLERLLNEKGLEISEVIKPSPIILNGDKYHTITITKADELICSITSENIICLSDYKVRLT